ncbi:MAG: MopE-related protein [Myxococcales bacterium]
MPADAALPGMDAAAGQDAASPGLDASGLPAEDAAVAPDAGIDPTNPHTCGAAAVDCFLVAGSNWNPATITCDTGACRGSCAAHYQDRDGDGRCEAYCHQAATDDKTCDGIDDDCNGLVDDGVDLCSDAKNCGACGHLCQAPHATLGCARSGTATCDRSNTFCTLSACDCTGPGDCWWNADGVAATGCEYRCDPTGLDELCGDGVDNDCDGKTDADDDLSGDPAIGVVCYGGTLGECSTVSHAGLTRCVGHQVVCSGPATLVPHQLPELCNGLDDDCDGVTDNAPTDVGGTCGGGLFAPCRTGTKVCQAGALACAGSVDPVEERCDGIDNDCDGTADNDLPAGLVGAACNVPVPPPAGATSGCQAGTTACVVGALVCIGSVMPTSYLDSCGVDSNCDGVLTNQPDLQTDVHNCGTCDRDCTASFASWSCVGGQCVFQSCLPGHYDLSGVHSCDYACTFVSARESCNGIDDNCDGQTDEPANLTIPAATAICGVNPSATTAECSPYNSSTNPAGVGVECQGGAWRCSFHSAGVCSPSCATATEVCDAVDNNCNGFLNENVPLFGQPCYSDTGQAISHGACRTQGTYACDTPTTAKCGAVKDVSKVGPELCDGLDNDCDGVTDEPFNAPGPNTTYFVKPAVTKIATAGLWISSYEASRPNATASTPGTGNGYTCAGPSCPGAPLTAPSGVPLDKTPACSVQGRMPWFNVTPIEAHQTCVAMGGHLCSTAEWQSACVTRPPGATTCLWGYAPNGTGCTSSYVADTKYCNLGPSYDFDTLTDGDQDGLLPTGSTRLANCFADWTALLSNNTQNGKIFDLTGNLREITRQTASSFPLMGGAFDTGSEAGARCDFTFYTVGQTFQLYDAGFRCCFFQDPTVYTCGNAVQDGTETDVNCGGLACPICTTGKKCQVSSDCASGICLATKLCQ